MMGDSIWTLWCFAGGDGERLCSPSFPVSAEAPAGARTLVLLSAGQHDPVLLLQERRKPLCPPCVFLIFLLLLLFWTRVKVSDISPSRCCFHADVCSHHLLVSVLLWLLWFSHDRPVVSHLLQLDVLRLPSTYHWYSGQRRVERDAPATTSALYERPELWGLLCRYTTPDLSYSQIHKGFSP